MTLPTPNSKFVQQVEKAASRIPPLWPLKHFVAVNPFLGLTDQRFDAAAHTVQQVMNANMLMSRSYYAEQILSGRISERDLEVAAKEHGLSVNDLKRAAAQPSPAADVHKALTVAEVLDEEKGTHFARIATEEISKWCASYYDQSQAVWTMPWKDLPIYAAWRAAAKFDRQPEVLGMPQFRKWVSQLSEQPLEAIRQVTDALGIPENALEVYLHHALSTVSGWASYVRYQTWDAELGGVKKDDLIQLLAVRLSFEYALYKGHFSIQRQWNRATFRMAHLDTSKPDLKVELALQRAFEHGFQRSLLGQLAGQKSAAAPTRKAVQMVFCIDVRSEVFRRSLETVSADIETGGFAGFFGLPIQYVPLAEDEGNAQCPVLLQPGLKVPETLQGSSAQQQKDAVSSRLLRKQSMQVWKAFKTSAVSSFAYVETAGLGFGFKLASDSFHITRPVKHPSAHGLHEHEVRQLGPDLSGFSADQKLTLAQNMLGGMSLKENFARLVVLAGHGSTTVNNPHASGLDCGACGGHTGEANARVAARILNDPAVRAGLNAKGIALPSDTFFVAALHNTTTDEVTLFDTENLPASHMPDLKQLDLWLDQAGTLTRTARSRYLGTEGQSGQKIEQDIARRSKDWSQVRPEWGLAGNAAFIAAPRSRTHKLNLGGRAFLHNYEWKQDSGFKVLELIMVAPMVVASWINLQYYGSTVDNRAFGSGNKVLHNVVGGTLGVLQGSRGDLQTGLPMQSLHDGEKFIHEPLRLSVLIEAPRAEIDQIIQKHGNVRDLLDHHWLYLIRITEEGGFEQYLGNLQWEKVDSN